MKDFVRKGITNTEAFLKGMIFDCKTCGQCVLSKTGLICPMTCPKGLRNGPCGGTIGEMCEVFPEKKCTWIRIHKRRRASKQRGDFQLLASPDPSLFHTSSYLNRLNHIDVAAKEYLPPLDLPKNRKLLPPQTGSLLEARLKSGAFVHTCEIRAPREADFARVHKEVEHLKHHFDAINATAYLNGMASLSSTTVAAELRRAGVESISQSTCRDQTKTSFISELVENMMNDVSNTLCLTGDAYAGNPKIKQVFDMDAALMLYEARYLREAGRVHFSGQKYKRRPTPFLGAAINPFTTPQYVPVERLKLKVAAGADFIQTQLILDLDLFTSFMESVCEEALDKEVFLLAGIPVIISQKAYEMLDHIPGVVVPEYIKERFDRCDDIIAEGISFAKELYAKVKKIAGVSGVHLMLFGSDHSVLAKIIE